MSDAARASLAAVQAAQEAARGRARRETRRTRAWLGGIVGGIAVGVLAFGPNVGVRVGAHKNAKAGNADLAVGSAAATVQSVGTPAATPAQAAAPAQASTAAPLSAPAVAVNVTAGLPQALPPVAPPVPTGDATVTPAADGECAETFGQRRWRLSIDACTRAFAERPQDGAIALRIAHAHHARARLPEAGQWANRALALDPNLAEAYVIVAHAEKHAGNSGAALEAYRHYLALAPRGWHASEARAAVRAHTREKSAMEDAARSHPSAAAMPGSASDAPGG